MELLLHLNHFMNWAPNTVIFDLPGQLYSCCSKTINPFQLIDIYSFITAKVFGVL